MRKLLLMLFSIAMLSTQLFAQTRVLSGKVTDEKGAPVPNASVIVKGTSIGTTTNAEGVYTITAPASAKALVISSIGLSAEEITIGTRTTFSTALRAGDKSLEEIVVTGYSRERKSQFTGSAAVLSGKVVEDVPVGSFDQALQGRAPGVLVNSSSGQPGTAATVTIRGIQSIQGAGAQPLYVLDGVPIAAGDFATLNPNDFESMTVLKDAGAAALYGARGGTGVIVITSKKGKAGQTQFTARAQMGFTQAPSFDRLNMMNSQQILDYEQFLGQLGQTTNTPGWIYGKFSPTYIGASAAQKTRYDFMRDSISKINTNYADVFYRQGVTQSYELNASGGSDKTRFFLSAGYFDQEGIDLGSALERYTTRFNIDHTSGKFSVSWNNAIGYSKTNLSEGEALGNSARNPFQMTYRAKPYEIPFKADGTPNFGASTTLALKQVGNLVEGIQNSSLVQKQIKLTSALTLGYKILPNLTLRNTTGIDAVSEMWQRYIVPGSYIGSLQQFATPTVPGGLDIEASKLQSQLINTSSLIYSKRINQHEFELGGYFEVVRQWQKAMGFTLYNLDPRLLYTGQGAGTLPVAANQLTYPQNSTSASSGFGIRSYFATARYTYNNKYTVTGNIRRDGTSRIVNEANREITTWSAGAIWNAMQEDFMKNQGILTDLRVRASYGVVPNIGSIATSSYGILGTAAGTWLSVTNFQGPQVPSFGATTYAGSGLTAQAPTSPGNPNLKIETIQKANIGVDFAVWRNRARFTVDIYKNKTVDLFVRQPLSATTAFANQDINAGIMTNKGLEFSTNIDVVKGKDFGISFNWNHSINKNNIEDLGLVNEYFLGTFVIRKGLPYGTHYTYNYLGADPATGRPRFETLDGKETLDAAQAGQFAKFGNYLPVHQGGFGANFSYKGFSLDAFFTYQFDVVRSNNIRNWITRGTAGYHASVNASQELITNQWQKPGDNKFFQSPAYDRGFTSSDLEDAKFLRFRNLNVAYNIPSNKFKTNSAIKGARFYVQMQNIAVWSPWTGLDPEDGNNISLNEYPNPKMIVGGIHVTF